MSEQVTVTPKPDANHNPQENQSVSVGLSQLVSIAAAVLGISFFLPWVQFFGASLSGFDIQKLNDEQKLLWAIPIFICAAPFGKSFFFSCRFAEIPAVIQWWQLLVLFVLLLVCLNISFVICFKVFGGNAIIIWPVGCVAFVAFSIYLFRNAVAMGLHNLDDTLIKSPVVGPIYERWFRKETYYREDTRLMYMDTVNAVVKAKVEEVTGAKGIKLIKFNEHNPILTELYKPTTVTLPLN